MKRTNQTLSIVFLLVLLGSSIFAVSATEYSVSEQSITAFSETLPDDVMFAPDLFSDSTIFLAVTGDDDYADSQVLDGTYWNTTGDTLEEAEFHLSTALQIELVNYAFYGHSLNEDGWLKIENDEDDWVILEIIAVGGDSWYNGTISDPDYFKTDNEIHLAILDEGTGQGTYCDYLEITLVSFMTLADANHYAEGFSNISDWAGQGNDAGDSFSTDNDVCSIEMGYVGGAADYKGIFTNAPNFIGLVGYYIELRIRKNTSDVATYVTFYQTDEVSGDRAVSDIIPTTTWTTFKVAGDSDPLECVYIGATLDPAESVLIEIDYLRVSPANESGWQHDGSTTEAVTHTTSANMEFTESSDDDILTLNATMINSYTYTYRYYIAYDTTSEPCDLNSDYYPFGKLRYRVTQLDSLPALYLTTSMGGYYTTFALDSSGDWTTFSWNQKATSNVASEKALSFHSTFNAEGDAFTIEIDYAKFYSIATYTVTQSGVGVDDYLFVDSGVLYSNIDDGYIVTTYDPTLSFETNRSLWTMTTSSGTPEIDFYHEGAWLGYTSDTEGAFSTGTLTDFRVKFTANANIEAITFLSPIPQWNDAGETTVYFHVPFDYWVFDMILIFLGLGMIILSSLYGAYKIRNDPDMNTVIIVLLLLMFGFALFLGGIGFVGGG